MTARALRPQTGSQRWLKSIGYFSFAFFLVKGLLWLAGGLVLYWLV